MRAEVKVKIFAGMALLVSLLSIAGGLLYLFGQFDADVGGTAMKVGVGTTLLLAGVLTPVGLWLSARSLARGSTLAAACAVPLGVCFWWTGIAPLLSLAVVVVGIRRSRRAAKQRASAL